MSDTRHRHRALLDAIDAGFAVVELHSDAVGRPAGWCWLEVDAAFERHTGLKDAVAHSSREVVAGFEPHWIDAFSRVASSGENVRIESRVDGPGDRWYELQAFRFGDAATATVGLLCQDITARKQTEAALRSSEAKFRGLVQAIPDDVWTALPDGRLDWSNLESVDDGGDGAGQGASRVDGPFEGDAWLELLHPDDRPAARDAWSCALTSGQPYESEFRVRRAGGAYRWFIARAVAIRDAAGRIVRWVGTSTDIDEQKANIEALARLARTLEEQVADRTADRNRLWQLSTDLMLVCRLDGSFVSANPALPALLGWSEEELLAKGPFDLTHPEDLIAARQGLERLLKGEAMTRLDLRMRHKHDGWRWISWAASCDGERITAVGRDVTVEYERIEALARSEEMLRQSQKLQAIGQLTGGVAHDFNNLLQVISGNLQLVSRLAGDAAVDERVAIAQSAVQRGATLARQLLAFSRRQPLQPRVVNVGRLIGAMADMLQRTIGDGISIEIAMADDLENVLADPGQIENAVLNLAINARDAMQGRGRLRIDLGNVRLDAAPTPMPAAARTAGPGDAKAGPYVAIAVADTGCGMSADVAERAFEPFFSTKSPGTGSGLGLSMVYGFARQSGGHARIDSEPGCGTTVTIWLPRVSEPETLSAMPEVEPVQGGHETVLVVEDDAAVRDTVVALLRELGYRVLEAADAARALDILKGDSIVDLLFTDVVMPGSMPSTELARKARELLPEVAVLFTSGYVAQAVMKNGRLDPGIELLGKPYTHDALARRLRHVLKQRPTAGSTAVEPDAEAQGRADSP